MFSARHTQSVRMTAIFVNFQNLNMPFSERKQTFLKRWKLESSRLRILGFERQILGKDCEVKPKGHKLKSVPATTGIKFLFSNE